MIGVLFLIIIFLGLNQVFFGVYKKRHSFLDKKKMNLLYFYHLIFYGIFLWYSYNNPADSKRYYGDLEVHSGTWWELFGTDTQFINFVSYPFYQLGFSYEMLMLTFAWFGYLGFLYAYLFIREKIPVKILLFKRFDFLTLILFLPNMHFWTSYLGKDSLIFMALMMFTYALIKPKSRLALLILASTIIFYIRPHVFMFAAVGATIGYLTGKEKVPFWQKSVISIAMITAVILVQDQILGVLGLSGSENLIEGIETETGERAKSLSTSGSGVEMASYPLPFKLFTLWFRPLFIDAPNALGIIISLENLLYLIIFGKILRRDFLKFLFKSPSLVKISLIIFLSTSLALTFVMSNLGIIIRQKSMVMYFIFFVIYYYLAQKKYNRIMKLRKIRLMRKMQAQNEDRVAIV